MLGGFSNVEGVDLRERGEHPVVTPVDKLGVPTYDELVLVAQRSALEEDPEAIRLFLAALSRGTAAAVEDPQAAVAALPKRTPASTRNWPRRRSRRRCRCSPQTGSMNPAEWTKFIGWMRDNGLIESLPAAGEVLDDSYLPGKISE